MFINYLCKKNSIISGFLVKITWRFISLFSRYIFDHQSYNFQIYEKQNTGGTNSQELRGSDQGERLALSGLIFSINQIM